ncbi:unnamed protein product [Paramecium pentaurelia]|uniref:Uncharacterized protein n=1 Tax=Paramecium pentaurelia TaxID=43138 RepID=A0A8S1VVX4_9CILI|nr:unnamed protein product [Paramecium pentaurelia]
MKYILIVALLILIITARSVHKNEDDEMTRCMAKHCKKQAGGCARIQGCAENLKNCANDLEKDEDLEKFDTCLGKVPQSYSLMECILQNCSDIERKSVEQLFKKKN